MYELIAIDNSEGQYSIFSAYSKGIKSAIGNIICFMHEDVSIETNGWMQSVESIFDKNVEIGLLGVIGDCAIPKQKPSYVGFELPVMHYQQQYGNRIQLVESNIDFYDKEGLCRVVAVDGLWFCIPRNLFVNQVVSFDDSFFHGFHMYDMDISLQVFRKGFNVAVTDRILVTHHNDVSSSLNNSFYNDLSLFYDRNKASFPLTSCDKMKKVRELSRFSEDYSKSIGNHLLKNSYVIYKILRRIKG